MAVSPARDGAGRKTMPGLLLVLQHDVARDGVIHISKASGLFVTA